MKLAERLIVYAVVVAGFVYFAFLKKGNDVQPQDKVEVKFTYDSLPKLVNNSTIEKPIVYKAGEINIPAPILNIMQGHDTVLLRQVLHEVLARYYEERVQHTTTVDSNIIINTWDSITENAIYGRKLQYKWLKPNIETTITKAPKQVFKVFVGANIEAGQYGFNFIGPEVSFLSKNDKWFYQVGWNGYDAIKGKLYSFSLSAHRKISFGKKK